MVDVCRIDCEEEDSEQFVSFDSDEKEHVPTKPSFEIELNSQITFNQSCTAHGDHFLVFSHDSQMFARSGSILTPINSKLQI